MINGKVGFPSNVIGKVTNILESNKVNYKVIDNDCETVKNNFSKNNYNKFYNIGKKSVEDINNMSVIISKIKSLNKEQLNKTINYIMSL